MSTKAIIPYDYSVGPVRKVPDEILQTWLISNDDCGTFCSACKKRMRDKTRHPMNFYYRHNRLVYAIYYGKQIIYIGCTKNIIDRLKYHKYRRHKDSLIPMDFDRISKILIMEFGCDLMANKAEGYLIDRIRPPLNIANNRSKSKAVLTVWENLDDIFPDWQRCIDGSTRYYGFHSIIEAVTGHPYDRKTTDDEN